MTKRQLWLITASILLAVLAWFIGAWLSFLFTPVVADKHGIKYTVREGSSIRAVIDDLYSQNIVQHPWLFRILVRIKGVDHELKTGDYLFRKGATPSKILEQITLGTGLFHYTFTIVPGWNFKDLRNALQHDANLRHTVELLSNSQLMNRIGAPANINPEGEFFPDTYYVNEGSIDISVLKRAYKAMQDKLNIAWQHRAPNLPFKTPYEALIAASIIEKEAYFKAELPKIAGVMVNRLRKDMLLQFDPTVIYGAGEHYTGKIHHSDLIANNPYNTYVNKGLTPTPISMPGLQAIEAVLHPQQHSYFYFVASGNGAHQFSERLEQHNQAVADAKPATQEFFNSQRVRFYLQAFL